MRRNLTKQLAIDEGKKYKYRSDFKKSEPNLYKKVIANNWEDEVFSHMQHKPKIWLEEECITAAKKCKTKSEFSKKYPGAYSSAKKHGWLESISKLYFKPVGNRALRCIYAYEFSDKHVYIGLTFNIEKRNWQHVHSKDSAVYQYKEKTGIDPILKQLTDYVDSENASELEGIFLKQYENEGWVKINKAKTGGLGTPFEKKVKSKKVDKITWNKDTITEEAKKYSTRVEFSKKSPSAYSIASRLKILDSVCKHMVLLQRRKWEKEDAKQEALKYQTKNDFLEGSNGCYQVCVKNGWIEEVCSHMKNGYESKKIYNNNIVIETLSHYNKMEQLKKSDDKFVRGCYWWLKRNNLIVEYKKFLARNL